MRKKLARYKYYIVNSTDVKDIFAYNKSFLTRARAQEAIDAYLDPECVLTIITGTEVMLERIRLKTAFFSKFKPAVKRRPNVKDRESNYTQRNRIAGAGVVTHLFKRKWDPMPTESRARKAHQLKDRDKIRNFILK